MNRKDRRAQASINRKDRKTGLLTTLTVEGDVRRIVAKMGGKTEYWEKYEFDLPEEMGRVATDWLTERHACGVSVQSREMTGQEQLEYVLASSMAFNSLITLLAEEAEGIVTWKELEISADDLACCGLSAGICQSAVSKIIAAFTPQQFCELAASEDRPEEFMRDPIGGSVNYGLGRIKDVVFGNRREDRIVTLDLND